MRWGYCRRLGVAIVAGSAVLPALCAAEAPSVEPPPSAWVRVDKGALEGDLVEFNEAASILPPNYFDEPEKTVKGRFRLIAAGKISTFVVDAMASTSRSLDFPGDEVVNVREGEMIMTDEPSGVRQTFKTGDYFIVPKHWRGTWTFKSVDGKPAREFSSSSAGQWSNTQRPLDRAAIPHRSVPGVLAVNLADAKAAAKPINFEKPAAPTSHGVLQGRVVFAGEPSVVYLQAAQKATLRMAAHHCDTTVRVITGSVVLRSTQGEAETFGPDEAVVITTAFRGTIDLGSDFSGISLIAAGTHSATSPATPVPAVRLCSAI